MAASANTLTAFNASANGTDVALVPASTSGLRIAVVALAISSGAGSVVTFNSKGSGAGTAASGSFTTAANGGFVLPETRDWFRTNPGEGLSVTASAASSVLVVYRYTY